MRLDCVEDSSGFGVSDVKNQVRGWPLKSKISEDGNKDSWWRANVIDRSLVPECGKKSAKKKSVATAKLHVTNDIRNGDEMWGKMYETRNKKLILPHTYSEDSVPLNWYKVLFPKHILKPIKKSFFLFKIRVFLLFQATRNERLGKAVPCSIRLFWFPGKWS